MHLMVNDSESTESGPDTAKRKLSTLMHVRFPFPTLARTEDPAWPHTAAPGAYFVISRRPGTSLLEAILAVALLGILVLTTVPLAQSSRAASRHATAITETAVLAEYLVSAARTQAQNVSATRSGLASRGVFDPPFEEFQWIIEPAGHKAPDGTVVVTVYSMDASTALLVGQ